ncbi:MAG: signal peptide peptidase SppA [Cetobacterium sp.]
MFILKYVFDFLKFVIREISSMIIKFIFFIVIVVVAINYFSKTKKAPVATKTYLKVDLSNDFKETFIQTPLNLKTDSINFYQLLNKVYSSKDDDNILGLVLFLDGNTLSRTQISELGEILNEFKESKKPIYSYTTSMDNNTLLLSSYSTESIMPPSESTTVNITGYVKDLPYFKDLTEKLGVDVNVIHVGDFKTYGENYTRKEMSPENRQDLKRILDKGYTLFSEDISKNLSIDINKFNSLALSGDLMGESSSILNKNKLISSLTYWENFKKDKNIESLTEIQDYQLPKKSLSKNQIAIIYAEGEINYTDSKTPTSSTITPEKIIPILEKADKDDKIKGVILRVNSPGGSALASDIIYNSIKKMSKPVYVSIGSVAASGGYYISTAATKIFANKDSITGSIGVVSLIPNFKKLSEKVGVNFEEVSLGKFSDLYSLTADMTPEKKEKIYKSNLKVYNEFLNKVAYGRNLPLSEVEKIAQGKIWLGEEAINIGLVNSIGGIDTTIKTLATDLNIKDNYSIVEVPYEENLKSMFESNFLPIQTLLNFRDISKGEVVKKIVKEDELLFKPILYMSF